MMRLIALFLTPPTMPPIDYPVAVKLLPKLKIGITKAFEFAYFSGARDGFVLGLALALLFLPSIRSRALKGANHVADNL